MSTPPDPRKELVALFDEMGSILELLGANGFKVNASRKVARVLEDMTGDITAYRDDPKGLQALDGIGKSSAQKICQYLQTGEMVEYDQLLEQVPEGLLAVLEIPGLGPKTVRAMWEHAGVESIEDLERAIAESGLDDVPRMGAKTISNITDSIEFMKKSGDRTPLGTALPLAEKIIEHLGARPGVTRIAWAGSLRRGRDTIGDIDILACCEDPPGLIEHFQATKGVEKVLLAGDTKCSIRLERGIQVDLRVVPEPAFGAALMYFTGSKEHNVTLRERAIKAGMRLNEYGLFPDDGEDEPPQARGVQPVAAATEESIYAALNLPMRPPELREDRDDLESVPDLVTVEDIKAELHAHTTASDGHLSLEELVAVAKARGFHTIAVTDHSRSSVQANGLDENRLLAHIDAIHQCNEDTKGITVLAGSEVDILSDGRLDYDDDLLAKLDVVVASPHVALSQDPKKATTRLLAAIAHPLVHIIGHPTGRIINRRPGLSPDIDALVAAAAEHDTALEINANPQRLDLRDVHVRAAVDAGCRIAIDTDAHAESHFDFLRYGVITARRGRCTAADCVNCLPAKALHAWLKSKRT
ncbi:MAG: DNA polymerase/3'-5' exonuclease PolX [Phycisphaerales bacterium]|nr:DNA polymerase/3'-5' exonuclease PolX [Phycisphaerales bacterium]